MGVAQLRDGAFLTAARSDRIRPLIHAPLNDTQRVVVNSASFTEEWDAVSVSPLGHAPEKALDKYGSAAASGIPPQTVRRPLADQSATPSGPLALDAAVAYG
ncbi:hypothetical protein ABZV24_10650 [Streptomyces sp. NPDC005251]|uniref:hypothetical protein n=1 Tax=Streptomyces sp. NPDC005251 TaxID=3157166 RepID=UPI0033AC99A1